VLLRGINVQQPGDYFQADPAQPPVFGLSRADFAGIRRLGFGVVRLTMSWSALQPSRGAFDLGYVARIREAVRWAGGGALRRARHAPGRVGQVHRDEAREACPPGLGPAVGWDGAPEWATFTDGLSTCRAADTRELSPAVAQASSSFYLDRDGIELVATWGRLAREFGGEAAVAGYDLLNEPHPGFLPGVNEGVPLGRFYARAIEAIRAGDKAAPGGFAHPVYFEPSVLWSGAGGDTLPPPGFTSDPQIVFAPHIYAESITLDRKAGLTAVSVEQGWQVARDAAATYDAPLWSGEWGWFGAPEDDLAELERYAAQEDAALAGGAWWVWRQPCGDPQVVGFPGRVGLAQPVRLPRRQAARAHPCVHPGALARLPALRAGAADLVAFRSPHGHLRDRRAPLAGVVRARRLGAGRGAARALRGERRADRRREGSRRLAGDGLRGRRRVGAARAGGSRTARRAAA